MKNTIACLDSDVVSVTYLHHFAREVLGLASIIRSSWRSVAFPQSQLVLFGFPGNVLVRREKDESSFRVITTTAVLLLCYYCKDITGRITMTLYTSAVIARSIAKYMYTII